MDNELTIKRENFCQAYILCQGNASAAYREAFNCEGSKPETVWNNASRLLADTKVKARVKELLDGNLIRHEMTVDGITEMLREDRELARDNSQGSAAVTASMGLAKLHGLIVEKKKIEGNLTIEGIKSELFGDDK